MSEIKLGYTASSRTPPNESLFQFPSQKALRQFQHSTDLPKHQCVFQLANYDKRTPSENPSGYLSSISLVHSSYSSFRNNVSVWVSVYAFTWAQGTSEARGIGSPGVGDTDSCHCLTRVLGTEVGFSARAGHALNYQVISLVPGKLSFKFCWTNE